MDGAMVGAKSFSNAGDIKTLSNGEK